MSYDNVTPFRPRPRQKPPRSGGGMGLNTHRGRAVLAQALTFIAFAVNFFTPYMPWSLIGLALGIAAAFIAFSNRGQAMPWANTHHEHALRTLMIGLSLLTLGAALTYVSSFLALATWFRIVVTLWACLRAGVGAVMAIMRKPIPNPRGALF